MVESAKNPPSESWHKASGLHSPTNLKCFFWSRGPQLSQFKILSQNWLSRRWRIRMDHMWILSTYPIEHDGICFVFATSLTEQISPLFWEARFWQVCHAASLVWKEQHSTVKHISQHFRCILTSFETDYGSSWISHITFRDPLYLTIVLIVKWHRIFQFLRQNTWQVSFKSALTSCGRFDRRSHVVNFYAKIWTSPFARDR